MQFLSSFIFLLIYSVASAFVSPQSYATSTHSCFVRLSAEPTSEQETKSKSSAVESKGDIDQSKELYLSQPQGGYTLKQRLREEIDSPFRKVRLLFFSFSVGSALTAFYFSALNTIKAIAGGYADAPPLDEALTNDAINMSSAIICGFLAYREYNLGQSNLKKLARGGALASLVVEPAIPGSRRLEMKSYRRGSRVLIAAGGRDYISSLARSMTSDQFKDINIIPEKLAEVDVIVVPVLLENLPSDSKKKNLKVDVGDTRAFWKNGVDAVPETDSNFDINRANAVVSFPMGSNAWNDYLESEIETAATQGYDVLKQGITLTIKKNGKVLRRATGLPSFGEFIGTMEVMDGSKFGMPGDSERYGGP